MLKALIVTFLSFALFQLAQAASVNIRSPRPNAVYEAGETVEIKWKLADGASVDKVMIALASGPAQALLIDEVIAPSVDAKNGTYKWKIPKNIKPNSQYVLEIGPHSADIAFAGYFAITKASNTKPSASVHSSSKVPVPSASASASASKSASDDDDKKKAKPTATLPSSVIKETPKPTPTPSSNSSNKGAAVRVMCVAYPDEDNEMTTTCRPLPVSTTVKPKVHGSHKRKEKASTTTTTVAKETPKPEDDDEEKKD